MTTKTIDLDTDEDGAEYTNEPIYWFAVLERSVAEGFLEDAARAVRELRRLGIDVTYRARPRLCGEGAAHAS